MQTTIQDIQNGKFCVYADLNNAYHYKKLKELVNAVCELGRNINHFKPTDCYFWFNSNDFLWYGSKTQPLLFQLHIESLNFES